MLINLLGISVYNSKLAKDVLVTQTTLDKMEYGLPLAAALLLKYLRLIALTYCRASGIAFTGRVRIRKKIPDEHLGNANTTP